MSDAERRLTGRLSRDRIRMLSFPRIPRAVLAAYRRIADLTATVSDSMDAVGATGVIAGSILRPTISGTRIVGQAITLRNVPAPQGSAASGDGLRSRLADIECHNLAEPGDVLVIQGIDGVSSMGAMSATIGLRQREGGAIVDGAVRDVARTRALGYPIWSRSVSPCTGKRRLQSVELNGPVTIAGVQVRAGDLVVADDDGVCIVPWEYVAAVAETATALVVAEAERAARVAAGVAIPDLALPAEPSVRA